MASEVTKYSVFDPRIIQQKPKYAVEKGALSLTNVSFNAQTASSSTVQFNVQVPSENVFVDRAVDLLAVQTASISLTFTGGTIPAGTSLAGLLSLGAFPVQQSVSQASATINDATVTVNTQDVLAQVLRLADMSVARRQRSCPTMLDRYAYYPDAGVVSNDIFSQYDRRYESDEVPNAAFNGFQYCSATWAPQTTGVGSVIAATTGTGGYTIVNGLPVVSTGIVSGAVLPFYLSWSVAEKLLLPPFIFAPEDELSTGLFGVQNFQVQLNLTSTPSRSIRVNQSTSFAAGGTVRAHVSAATVPAWGTPNAGIYGPFNGIPQLSVQFLTPSLDVPLPPKSIVPYMEFPRYLTTGLDPTASTLQSNTITLPNIPDLLMIYARPTSVPSTQGDWSMPITNISMNFDNYSGLLSSMTQDQLYKMSVDNGVDMDWSEWTGAASVPGSYIGASWSTANQQGGFVPTVGGPLVLRPGRDFPLSTGQAPGLVGNFTLQFNLKVDNTYLELGGTVTLYVVTISSGFFETIKGSSRIIKGVLTEQDILSAPAHAPEADLERPVGAGRHGGAFAGLSDAARQRHFSTLMRSHGMGGAHGGAHGGRHGGAHGGAHGGRHGGAHGGMGAYM